MQPAGFIGLWQAFLRLNHSEKALGICVENPFAVPFLALCSKHVLHELVGDMLGRILSDMDYRLVCHLGILRIDDAAMLTRLLGSLFCVASRSLTQKRVLQLPTIRLLDKTGRGGTKCELF
jgi:hypothetical protein